MLMNGEKLRMKREKTVAVFLMALMLIGLLGALLSSVWLVRLIFVLIAAISGYTYLRWKASRSAQSMKAKLDKQTLDSHLEMLNTVNHLRHDWMNDIQVLSGYIQLKKYEHLSPYMDKIKLEMQQESLVSKLGIPSLVAYLLAFRVHSRSIQLEIGLDQEVNLQALPIRAQLAAELIKEIIEMFKQFALYDEQAEVGVLSLEFDVREQDLLLDFVYHGTYDREGLEQAINRKLQHPSKDYEAEEHVFREEEAELVLRLPYRT